VTLLHVYDAEAREMLSRAMVPGDQRREYLHGRAAEAKKALGEFATSVGLEFAALRVEQAGEPVSDAVQRIATEAEADLIIVPRSNEGAIDEGVVGSVTAWLLLSGECDVLMVPSV